MRSYGRMPTSWWVFGPGRALRHDHDALVVALYLRTCRDSTMTGLFYVPMATIASETGSPLEGASKALLKLAEVGEAYYDEASDVVWIPEMASVEIGHRLDPNDNQRVAIFTLLEPYKKHRFYSEFVERYGEAYRLSEAPSKPLRRGSKAPTKGKRSPSGTPSLPDPSPRSQIPAPDPVAEAEADTHTPQPPKGGSGGVCVPSPSDSHPGEPDPEVEALEAGTRRVLEKHRELLVAIRKPKATPRADAAGAQKAWAVLCDMGERVQDAVLEAFVLCDERTLVDAGHPLSWLPARINGLLSTVQIAQTRVRPDPRGDVDKKWQEVGK